jgi:hypothetical protein
LRESHISRDSRVEISLQIACSFTIGMPKRQLQPQTQAASTEGGRRQAAVAAPSALQRVHVQLQPRQRRSIASAQQLSAPLPSTHGAPLANGVAVDIGDYSSTRVRTVENSGAFGHIYRGRGGSMAIATPANWCCLCLFDVRMFVCMDVCCYQQGLLFHFGAEGCPVDLCTAV